MNNNSPRLIDHAVLPVPDLDTARTRMTKLGFTVAPDARHSFGTENSCVNFGNGTFLEPLAIGHRETVEEDEKKGNTFLRRDAAYRFRNGDNGFSLIVFCGEDAGSEREMFKQAGYDTGKLVTVRRPGVEVGLAFALDARAPDMGAFLCERPNGPPKFPEELTSHENGALKIDRVTMVEPVPSDFQYYLQTVSGQREVRSHSFGMDMEMPNGNLSVLTPAGMKANYGEHELPSGRGLRLMAIDIAVSSLEKTISVLTANKIDFQTVGSRVVIAPALGQGAILAFVENRAD